MSEKLTVSLIVVNNFHYLFGALRSLYQTTSTPCKIYVILNTPNLQELPEAGQILAAFPEVQYLVNVKPKGFAANHNRVLALAQTEYIALLNDDIILRNTALDILVRYLEEHPDVGLVGCQQYNPDMTYQVAVYDDPGIIRMIYKISGLAVISREQSYVRKFLQKTTLARFLGVESLKVQTTTHAVDIIKGVVMVVRKEVYEQVGGMDETTLAYGEEADWHLRIRKAGWKIVFVAEAAVIHFGQGQAQLRLPGQLLYEDRKSILNYYLKHRPRHEVWLIRGAIAFFHFLWAVFWFPVRLQRSKTHLHIAYMGLTWQSQKRISPEKM